MRLDVAAVAALLWCFTGATALAQPETDVEWSAPARLASRALMLDVARAGDAVVAVGERGLVLISDDRGQTWTQARVPTRATLTGVWFHDRQRGWAVGHDAVIIRTTDGGQTWTLVQSEPDDEVPFLDVWFSDAENGLAIGAYGLFYVTSDGGQTWNEERVSENDFHLNQIAASETGRLYIAAEAGTVYRSDDGGTSWTLLDPGYPGSFFGVLPLAGDEVLLYGLRGHLFRSEDAGATWTQLETGTTSMLNGGVRLDDGRIVIVGLGGSVLISRDGGRTFALHGRPNRAGIQQTVPLGGGQLILAGEFGVLSMAADELESSEGR